MSHVRRVVACIVASTAALFAFSLPATTAASAVPSSSTTAANAAVAWLQTQQQADGGFEQPPPFPGFETPDAALAIAENGQTTSTWSTTEAVAAVDAVKFGGAGPTAFDYLDTYAASGITVGKAAKLIVQSAGPFGFDPAAFDPAGDGTPTDLTAIMGCGTTSAAAFNDLVYIVLAQTLACGDAQATAVTAIRGAQQANGSWNFTGDPNGTEVDNDTTAVAIQALVASGAGAADPAIAAAIKFLASSQQANGAWQATAFPPPVDDPNSTAVAILAVTAAGYDVESSCWRDTADPTLAGTAYTSPTSWLISQQQSTGRVASPNDGFGINTFATSQAVQGLLQSWLPVQRAAAQTCELSPTPVVTTTTPTAGGSVTVRGGGFAPATQLTIELHSTPVVLGTTTTDTFGNYSATVVIPVATDPGAHQLVISGTGADGQPRTVAVDVTVLAAEATAPVALTSTPRFTG